MLMSAAFAADSSAQMPIVEAWISVSDLERVEGTVGIDHGTRWSAHGLEVQVVSSAQQFRQIAERGIRLADVRAPQTNGIPDGYITPDEADAELSSLAGRPNVGLVQLGVSEAGTAIVGAWFGDDPDLGSPTSRVTGAHHGDELSSSEVAMALARQLASEPPVGRTVWVIPFVNPDGARAASRFNANGVDLNRNYGAEWSEHEFAAGHAPFSESETRALALNGTLHPATIGLALHAGARNIGYPWNHTTEPAADADVMNDMGHAYAQPLDSFDVTNGAAWYITTGDHNDWAYARTGSLDFTVELTVAKTPPAGEIEHFVGDHLHAILEFLAQPMRFGGAVYDAQTGHPVSARVTPFSPAGPVGQPFSTHPVAGSFYRSSTSATHWHIEAAGYEAVEVPVGVWTDVVLEPSAHDPRAAFVVVDKSDSYASLQGTLLLRDDNLTQWVSGNGFVDPNTLEPGLWHLSNSDGVHRDAVLIAPSASAGVTEAIVSNQSTRVKGWGLTVGSRAYRLLGPQRARVPASVSLDNGDLIVDARPPFLVVTNGSLLWVTASSGQPTAPQTVILEGVCACASSGAGRGPFGPVGLFTLFALWRRRP